MKRGEIRWYTFKSPDKKRPVLILTRDSIIPYLHEITIAPITTVIREIPSECFLPEADGLLQDSAVNLDHIQTIAKNKLGKLICKVSTARMQEVEIALKFASGMV
jgi:mRNA interferase MazF